MFCASKSFTDGISICIGYQAPRNLSCRATINLSQSVFGVSAPPPPICMTPKKYNYKKGIILQGLQGFFFPQGEGGLFQSATALTITEFIGLETLAEAYVY